MKKLSEYTIATNCADIVDCQDGVAEIREEIGRRYEKKQDVPLYFYSRLNKLEKKLEKLAMKNYGMSYREAVIKFGYDNLRGMGKTNDKEKIATALTITIFEKTSTSHRVGLPRTCKRRSTTTKPRLVYTKRDVLSGANINNFADKTKLFELINNFNIDDAEAFIKAIGKCFPQQEEKEHRLKASFDSKYQILDFSEFGVKVLLRVSDHNINAFNIQDDIDEAYSLVVKDRKSKNTFVNRDDITIREYVYWEENCNRDRYLKIAQNIYKFLETSEWDEDYVKADATNPPATKGLGEYPITHDVGDIVAAPDYNKIFLVVEVDSRNDRPTFFRAMNIDRRDRETIYKFTFNDDRIERCYAYSVNKPKFKIGALTNAGRIVDLKILPDFKKDNREIKACYSYKILKDGGKYSYYDEDLLREFAPDVAPQTEVPKYKVGDIIRFYYVADEYEGIIVRKDGENFIVKVPYGDGYRLRSASYKDIISISTDSKSLFQFAQHLSAQFDNGESYDWAKVQRLAKELGVKSTQQELMQACELAVVLSARQIAHNGQSIAQRFAAMKDLYGQQVTVRPLDTQSKILQQYSTPCPLAFLLGVFVDKNDQFWNGRILEPSAGNGLLTVALHESQTVVNEIDEIRVANLKQLGFASVTSEDASSESAMQKFGNKFRGIITNPPFAKLADKDKIERHGWPINTLDYKMAVLALDRMSDNGKAAIIVGGKMWNSYWKPLSERSEKQVLFGQWKTFLGYLYAQYNVADVIYINGENIYRKQGTTYPIVAILVDGRHEYDESVKPNYVFDSERDVIIDTFDQLLERIMPHLDPNRHDEAPAISLLKAKFGKNVRPSDYEATGDNPIHAYKYPTGTMYADTRFQLHDSNGWDFLPVAFRFDSGTVDVKCNVLPEYEQLIDSLKDNDMRKRLARAKAKALLMYAYAQKQNDGHLVDGSQKSSERHGVEVALNIPMLEKGIDSILNQYSGRDAAAAQVERYMEESVFVSRAWLKQKGLENREQFRKWLANRQSVVRKPIVAERRKELQQANEYFANYRVKQMLDEAHQQAEAWEKSLGDAEQNVPKFNFRKSLAQYFANSFVGRFIGVAMPKPFLTDCGIPELPIMISKRTLTDKIKQHSLDRDCLKNLDSEINSPVLVFKSENVKDAFNIIVSKSNDEGLLCVSIHTNQKADKILINEIASIHGRRLNQLVRWAEDGYLLKSNVNKAKKVFSGSQFNSAQSEYFLSLIDEANVTLLF